MDVDIITKLFEYQVKELKVIKSDNKVGFKIIIPKPYLDQSIQDKIIKWINRKYLYYQRIDKYDSIAEVIAYKEMIINYKYIIFINLIE